MSQDQDRTFIVTFVGVIAVLVVVTIILIALAVMTRGPGHIAEERETIEYQRAERNLQPPGAVRLTGEPMPELAVAEPEPAAADLTPQDINQNYCMSCHATGVMNAPVTGTEGDWTARLGERGFDGLVQNAIDGIGAMPPRGGNPRLSDDEIRETVRYMLEESGISVN
ncbi:hypothetical protein CAI21_08175 [Alkalilimnicola ehrlichii]|uniref:Cytochrome c domain-containing protein n=1 Tax=Alkalilimnicola ehrlichii TaxID=351052 RepID=A0A3E0WZ89_9GAMM|nr:c-type cytochrome [Alkalilimnicola ehrlichii]RFA30153.1 hypothetical protein CAI21_08175 [Alkalilimnicola ehrlichii]RFA37501.1 hypothetical protein CAL65_09520 [Alkalilimnicola ehrlichii]